jgi:hypothetical protein
MICARTRLPDRRGSSTFNLEVERLIYTVTVSYFPDGRLGELFISNGKAGSHADTCARDSAVVVSLALQHGVPLETLRKALMRDSRGRPGSPLGAALDLIASEQEAQP